MGSVMPDPGSDGRAAKPGHDSWYAFFLTAGFGEAAAEHYSTLFKAQEMELDMVPELSHDLLIQMGVTKAGPRIKMLRLKDAIFRPKTGEIVTEANDVKGAIASFNYGGKVYQLTSTSESVVAPMPAVSQPMTAVSSKPILIPVTLDKKRIPMASPSSAENGGSRGVNVEPPVRPASTSSLVMASSSKADLPVPSIPTSILETALPSTHYATAPSSPDATRRTPPLLAAATASMHGSLSDLQAYGTESDLAVAEGTYHVNPETGEVIASGGPMVSTSSGSYMAVNQALPLSSSPSSSSNSHIPVQMMPIQSAIVRYFMNDEVAKHRVRVQGEANVKAFSAILKVHHKLTQDFAVFMFDLAENRLRVLKDTAFVDGSQVYYVLENARIDDLYRKVEKRVKKDLAALGAQSGKTSTWNSENNPLRVDFVPDSELYLTEAGRIGLCMCPGRKKKKAAHEWDRDLEQDLLRIRDHYKCDVVVSLVRRSELVELKIPTLLEDIERLGMESIHFPIKDKWIPDSMADVIRLVDTLVQRLKVGKTIVIHCNGGKGRSGTVAVACMVAMGKRVVQSIDVVRKARSGTIRNPVQIVYVKRFKTAFKSYLKKKQALIEAKGGTMGKEEWEALAEQVAQDANIIDDSSDSESDVGNADKKARREEEKAAEKARKEEEKAAEKAEKVRKEEEKAAEKVRKEEEKAAEKARKEEEKTQEKARKEGERTQEKARKEEEKAAKKSQTDSDIIKRKNTGTPLPIRGGPEVGVDGPAAASPIPNGPSSPQKDVSSSMVASGSAENLIEPKPASTGSPDGKPKNNKKPKASPPSISTPNGVVSTPSPTTSNNDDGVSMEKADTTATASVNPVSVVSNESASNTPKRAARRKSAKKVTSLAASDDIVASTGSEEGSSK